MRSKIGVGLVCGVLAGCLSGSETETDKATPIVVVTPQDLEDAFTVRLAAKTAADVHSNDGKLTVRVWADSFIRDTQLTVARLRSASVPKGVIGPTCSAPNSRRLCAPCA
jgi:hypothetical protein